MDTVKSIENGRRAMSLDTYLGIVQALETSPLALMGREQPEQYIERFIFMMNRRNEREIEFALHMYCRTVPCIAGLSGLRLRERSGAGRAPYRAERYRSAVYQEYGIKCGTEYGSAKKMMENRTVGKIQSGFFYAMQVKLHGKNGKRNRG